MTNLEKTLQDFANDFELLLKNKAYVADLIATGELMNTLEVSSYYVNNKEFKVIMRAQDYAMYALETGRKPGKKPPYKNILEWIKIKQILPRPNKLNPNMTQENLAYLIQSSIGKKGVTAKKLVSKTLQEILTEYRPKIKEAIKKDTEQGIYKMMTTEFYGYNNVKIKIK